MASNPTRAAALSLLTAVLSGAAASRRRWTPCRGHRTRATAPPPIASPPPCCAGPAAWTRCWSPSSAANRRRCAHALRIGAAELLLLGTPRPCRGGQHRGAGAEALRRAGERRAAQGGGRGPRRAGGAGRPSGWIRPPWLWSAWHAAYGPAVRAIAEAHASPAPLDLTLAPGATAPEGGRSPAHRHRAPARRHPRHRPARLRGGRLLGAGRRRHACPPGCWRRGRGAGGRSLRRARAARRRSSRPPAPR